MRPSLTQQAQHQRFANESYQQPQQLGCQCDRNLRPAVDFGSRQGFESMHGAVGIDGNAAERWDFRPREGEARLRSDAKSAPAKRVRERGAAFTDAHGFVQVLVRIGLV